MFLELRKSGTCERGRYTLLERCVNSFFVSYHITPLGSFEQGKAMAGQVTLQTRIDSYDPMPKYVARLTNSRVALSKTRDPLPKPVFAFPAILQRIIDEKLRVCSSARSYGEDAEY
jgi:hypothetical protein